MSNERKHMSFDEALELLQVGAVDFSFTNHAFEVFEVSRDNNMYLSIKHVPKEGDSA